MTVQEAYAVVKGKYQDMVAIDCLDFPDFYAFGLTDHGSAAVMLLSIKLPVNWVVLAHRKILKPFLPPHQSIQIHLIDKSTLQKMQGAFFE